MDKNYGLYVSLLPNGEIKRTLLSLYGTEELELTTINEEIITYSELIFLPYSEVVDTIILCHQHMTEEGDENFGGINRNVVTFINDILNDLLVELDYEQHLFGALTRTALDDRMPPRSNTPELVSLSLESVIQTLTEVIEFQFHLNGVLNDVMRDGALTPETKRSWLREITVRQVMNFEDGITTQYHFRSIIDYYQFLLIHFLDAKPIVALCQCCGRFFIPRTKKTTLYCDRIFKDGKTCKQVAPAMKHKIDAGNKKVIEEFDRAKRRMYKRYERANLGKQKSSDKDLSYSEYYDWLDKATKARDDFLAEKLSEEEALKIIIVP